jgi:D-sedoheptulose 7-phosphate isomerase
LKTSSRVSLAASSSTGVSQIADAHQYFQVYKDVATQLPYSAIDEIAEELLNRKEQGRTVFLFGNGGSASLASHFACDLGKGTVLNGHSQARFRVVALTDNVPLMTAWANDRSYESIFAEQLSNLVSPGDVAFAISGSGSSPNVLAGLKTARAAGAVTMGLTGAHGTKMKALCDYCVMVPSDNMQIIEDFHLGVAHAVFTIIRGRIAEAARLCDSATAAASG